MEAQHDLLEGVHVLVVEDTPDSASRLETIRPHGMVSDIAMPDDGLELICQVKVIADSEGLTAHTGRHEELLAEGFAELVEKPLDPLRLCQTVRRHAQRDT